MRAETRVDVTRAVRTAIESDEEIQTLVKIGKTETRRDARGRAPGVVARPGDERLDPNAAPRAVRPSAGGEKFPTRFVIDRNAVVFVDVIGVISVVFVTVDVNLNRRVVERGRKIGVGQDRDAFVGRDVGFVENVFFGERFDEFFLERVLTEPIDASGFVVDDRRDDVEPAGANQILNDRRFQEDRFERLPNDRFGNDVRKLVALQIGVSFFGASDGRADQIVRFEVVRDGVVDREALVGGDFRGFRLGAFLERIEFANEIGNVAARVMSENDEKGRSQVEDAVFDRGEIVGGDRARGDRRHVDVAIGRLREGVRFGRHVGRVKDRGDREAFVVGREARQRFGGVGAGFQVTGVSGDELADRGVGGFGSERRGGGELGGFRGVVVGVGDRRRDERFVAGNRRKDEFGIGIGGRRLGERPRRRRKGDGRRQQKNNGAVGKSVHNGLLFVAKIITNAENRARRLGVAVGVISIVTFFVVGATGERRFETKSGVFLAFLERSRSSIGTEKTILRIGKTSRRKTGSARRRGAFCH